jgi:hypothetical protein
VGTTLLFALVPALQATRRDPADALARGDEGHVGGRPALQHFLVGVQVALAIVLLAGAGLLVRSFARMQTVSPGFDAEDVMTFRMSAQWSERTDAVVQRHARTIARLRRVPGIEASAFSQLLPAGTTIPPGEFQILGRDTREKTFATSRTVSSGYFRTLHIPILEGDTCSDDPGARPFASALVTRSFADRFFPNETPIGQHLGSPGQLVGQTTSIIGIVGDVRENGLLKEPEPSIYWCTYTRIPGTGRTRSFWCGSIRGDRRQWARSGLCSPRSSPSERSTPLVRSPIFCPRRYHSSASTRFCSPSSPRPPWRSPAWVCTASSLRSYPRVSGKSACVSRWAPSPGASWARSSLKPQP